MYASNCRNYPKVVVHPYLLSKFIRSESPYWLMIKPKNLKLLNSMNSQHASMWQFLINGRVPAKKYLNSLTFIPNESRKVYFLKGLT